MYILLNIYNYPIFQYRTTENLFLSNQQMVFKNKIEIEEREDNILGFKSQ